MKAAAIPLGGVIPILVFAAALTALSGCDNLFQNWEEATKQEATEEEPKDEGETETPKEEHLPEFSFQGILLAEGSATAGVKAGFFQAGEDQGALSYTLAEGEGGGNNGSFEVRDAEVFIKAPALSVGDYRLRVRAANSAGAAQEKGFIYTVNEDAGSDIPSPEGFKAVPGLQRISASWQAVEGAVSYRVCWVEAADDSSPADALESETPGVTITGLADSTVYTVWVKAKDSAGKLGLPSDPVSCRKTSDAVNPFWYTGDFDYWDSETDGYEITAATLDYNTMAPWNDNGYIGGFKYKADIRYYVEFDPAEIAEKAPKGPKGKPKTDTGKYEEDLTGYPAGVFIVEYRDDLKPADRPGDFFGVYFYGLGAVQTNTTTGLTWNHGNDRLAYLGNSYGLSQDQGGPQGVTTGWDPETETLEEAIDRFTLENMHRFIAFVATPWYRIKGAYNKSPQWVRGGSFP
jgi:hypothetical protein